MKNWLFLTVAIASEVVATTALKSSEGFTRFLPSLLVVVGYGVAFYALSLTLRTIPLGVAYAVWSGLGIVAVSVLALMLYGQKLDMPAIIGIALIVLGVIVINVFSNTSAH
ncbi:multidrug efflux SMR transporter [Pontibacterium granulatum]|uniref:DMT family transporter n=1 Tax=Pontibacterium granulatum TaxID=2036029 RepID=UPI00249B28EB|nr:multidrug efflux SMR transporter [Pontibacterium granulatum]MDI3324360.1 multidrug efflux SMR transporter [Pontibacterium granulatum]